MTATGAHNAIIQRLDRLAMLWQEFAADPDARICRWLVEVDEYPMMDAFYEFEASEGGNLSDVFLRFDQTFEEGKKYGHQLREAFIAMIEADRELLKEEEGIEIAWRPGRPAIVAHNSLLFNIALSEFAEQQEEIEDLIVAYLSPEDITDIGLWINWMSESLEAGIPANVRWMIVDTTASPVFDVLVQRFPNQVKTISPNLDMDGAMTQLAAVGNPTEPGVQYRIAYVALTQAAGKDKWEDVYQYAAEALQLARQYHWPHLEIAVHMAVGGAELGKQKREQALQTYQRAEETGKQALDKKDDDLYRIMLVQAYFGQGSALIALGNYESAGAGL